MRAHTLSSTTLAELSNRHPCVPLTALAVPGYPIPIIGTTVIVPVVWPDAKPSILPTNVDTPSISGGQAPPNMDWQSIFGGSDQNVAEVPVNWLVRVKSGAWHRECPVLDAIRSYLLRIAPVTVATTVPIAIKAAGIYNIVVAAADWWPIAQRCKPCPAGPGGVPYQKVRNTTQRLLELPDEGYIAIAKATGIIRCRMLRQDVL